MSLPGQSKIWALSEAGFRLFFLGAAFWAIAAMLLWFGILHLGWQFSLGAQAAVTWHAHEMVYGYGVAVVAGFLLTAVPNWTNTKPLSGPILIGLFSAWLAARLIALIGGDNLLGLTAGLDLLFIIGLLLALALPIVSAKLWMQSAVLAKVALLGLGNGAYYLGASGHLENGVTIGLLGGFYLLIALILTLGRRVIPFFIERRLGLTQPIGNDVWVDRMSLLLFFIFWLLQVFSAYVVAVQIVALLLFGLHAFRLYHWHREGIWSDPLLWVLFLAYAFIVLGFALAAAPLLGAHYSPFLALHLFAIGGIGLITCGMMARVALGHTGRDVKNPPKIIAAAFVCIALAAIVRVFLPMFFLELTALWLSLSQWLWIFGFVIFVANYLSVLASPRIDGKPG